MDSLLAAAADALSRGDPLFALKRIALREDAGALALRATAMAQLGDYRIARQLFLRASRSFGPNHPAARARCTVALAEVALAARELGQADSGLVRALEVLEKHGDLPNARYAQLLRARQALALGNLDAAQERLGELEGRRVAPALRAQIALAKAEVALRRIQPERARKALLIADQAARHAQIPALRAEVEVALGTLEKPVARLVDPLGSRILSMAQVSDLLAGPGLIVDACHRVIRQGLKSVSFENRPALFSLARRLAETAPREVSRDELIRTVFGIQRPNESLRVRLRVALSRLRTLLRGLAELEATPSGFALLNCEASPTYVLVPPLDDEASSLLALISDGNAWSTSALALALGSSQRSVQRALGSLEEAGKVRSVGSGRNRRWLAPPLTRFAPHLLLPGSSRTH